MDPLLGLLLILVAAGGFVALSFLLERRLSLPGLGFVLCAALLFAGSALGFFAGNRLVPTLFAIQAIGLLFSARLRRRLARTSSIRAIEA